MVGVTLATPYKIHLDTYDGPLDLLLDLIRKQEIDIHNIPIAKITGQYLEYLHKLEDLDIDVSADFIYMAATLILIKSKMLLPPDPLASPEEQQIDPRAELVQRLVEYEQFKSAAQLLHQKQQLEAHVWSKPDMSLYESEETQGELVVSLVDLVRVFQQVLERRKQVAKIELRHDTWTVERMVEVLRAQLLTGEEGIELAAFFDSCPSRSAMICALLAVLELVRLQAIVLKQTEIFGSIVIRKHKMFDVVFAGGELSATVRTPHSIDGSTASNESKDSSDSDDTNETSEPAS